MYRIRGCLELPECEERRNTVVCWPKEGGRSAIADSKCAYASGILDRNEVV